VISATNQDLHEPVSLDRFREDLFYRLDVYNIHVPPLRERAEDIRLLAQAFLVEFRAEMGKPVVGISDEAMDALSRYSWPGNVRELQNAIERSLLTCSGDMIARDDLPDRIDSHPPSKPSAEAAPIQLGAEGLDDWLRDTERQLIVQVLDESDGVQASAAKRRGITERSLWHRLKKWGIKVNRKVAE